jgi:hypothetical protein
MPRWPQQTLEERFWRHVSPEPNSGCWLWDGYENGNGYGTMRVQSGMMLATHVSLRLRGIKRPKGAMACHHCDVRACVNHEHLYWGSAASNAQDAVRRGRHFTPPQIRATADRLRSQTHCKRGHEFTPENTYLRARGHRECRACVAAAARLFRASKSRTC